MKQFLREYFTYNKRERNGIFVLVSILLLLLLSIHYSEKFETREIVDFTQFERELQRLDLNAEQTIKTDSGKGKRNLAAAAAEIKPSYFYFDPNHLSEQDWKRLGLSDKQIHIIKNYESKGGTFKTKEDVKKIYSISPSQYLALEPYIKIPAASIYEKKQYQPGIRVVEINSADSLQLSAIKGVGPFYAKMIIRYRSQLGGFYAKEQLLEVWRLDKEKYDAIEQYITVDTSKINKININTCTPKELKHPYLSWKIVNGIINYRIKHGDFYTVSDIKNTDLIDPELFSKMAPYLKSEK